MGAHFYPHRARETSITDDQNPFRSNPIRLGNFALKVNRSAADAAVFFGLSPRELEVLDCLAMGMSGQEAATKMNVSINTMATYKARCMEKLGTDSVSVAVHLVIAYCSGADLKQIET